MFIRIYGTLLSVNLLNLCMNLWIYEIDIVSNISTQCVNIFSRFRINLSDIPEKKLFSIIYIHFNICGLKSFSNKMYTTVRFKWNTRDGNIDVYGLNSIDRYTTKLYPNHHNHLIVINLISFIWLYNFVFLIKEYCYQLFIELIKNIRFYTYL